MATDAAIADPVAPPRMLVLQCHGVDAEGKFLKSMGINLHKRDDFDHVGWFDTHRAIVDLQQPQEEDIWKNDNFFFQQARSPGTFRMSWTHTRQELAAQSLQRRLCHPL